MAEILLDASCHRERRVHLYIQLEGKRAVLSDTPLSLWEADIRKAGYNPRDINSFCKFFADEMYISQEMNGAFIAKLDYQLPVDTNMTESVSYDGGGKRWPEFRAALSVDAKYYRQNRHDIVGRQLAILTEKYSRWYGQTIPKQFTTDLSAIFAKLGVKDSTKSVKLGNTETYLPDWSGMIKSGCKEVEIVLTSKGFQVNLLPSDTVPALLIPGESVIYRKTVPPTIEGIKQAYTIPNCKRVPTTEEGNRAITKLLQEPADTCLILEEAKNLDIFSPNTETPKKFMLEDPAGPVGSKRVDTRPICACCAGRGNILLFTSTVACDSCGGSGKQKESL